MNTSPYLDKFVVYLSGLDDKRPSHQFPARATLKQEAPKFFYTLPLGDIITYPNFLVFLTLSEQDAGAKLMFTELFQTIATELKTTYTLNKWINNPTSLLMDAAKWLSRDIKNEDLFAKALMNPNSVFIPFDEIIGVQFKKGIIALRAHHIRITLRKGGFVICQDPATENQFETLMGQFSGHWQDKFFELMTNVAQKNLRK